MTDARRLLFALCAGLLVAAVPILATSGRPCDPVDPPAAAPRYVVLASDATLELLRCREQVTRLVALEPVTSPEAVLPHLTSGEAAGVIFGRTAFQMTPGWVLRDWLTAGGGSTLVGLGVPHWWVNTVMGDVEEPGGRALLGARFLSLVWFETGPGGAGGGGGAASRPYAAGELGELLRTVAAGLP